MKKRPKQKILITGSAGFMGSHLYDCISRKYADKYDIYGIDDLSGGFMSNVSQPKYFTKLDLRQRTKASRYIEKLRPNIIFHFAADATEGRSQFTPFSAVDRNLIAYMNLLVPSIKWGVKKVILISSMSVYGKQQAPFREYLTPIPEDIYGVTKTSMEQMTKILSSVYGFKYLIFRPHNVYGPRQNLSDPYRNVIGIFINRLLQGKKFYIYGDGKQKRAFSYIDDIIPLIEKISLGNRFENETLNVGSDKVLTVNQLSKIVLGEFFGTSFSKKMTPHHLPSRPREVKIAFCDHGKIKKMLKLLPETKLREGLRQTIAWAKSIGPQEFVYLNKLELLNRDTPKTWTGKLY